MWLPSAHYAIWMEQNTWRDTTASSSVIARIIHSTGGKGLSLKTLSTQSQTHTVWMSRGSWHRDNQKWQCGADRSSGVSAQAYINRTWLIEQHGHWTFHLPTIKIKKRISYHQEVTFPLRSLLEREENRNFGLNSAVQLWRVKLAVGKRHDWLFYATIHQRCVGRVLLENGEKKVIGWPNHSALQIHF